MAGFAKTRVVLASFELVIKIETPLVFGLALFVDFVEVTIVEVGVAAAFAIALVVAYGCGIGATAGQGEGEKSNGGNDSEYGKLE